MRTTRKGWADLMAYQDANGGITLTIWRPGTAVKRYSLTRMQYHKLSMRVSRLVRHGKGLVAPAAHSPGWFYESRVG